MKRILLFILFAVLFSACTPVPQLGDKPQGIGKEDGFGRGIVSNVDPLNNGLFAVWIFGDNINVYCTMDKSIITKIKDISREWDATVYYTYRDWKVGDPEVETLDSYSHKISASCGQGTAHGSKLMSVEIIKKSK